MECEIDTCPTCESEDLHYLGAYNIECNDCEHTWNDRELHGLSPTNCEACGHRLSFGCGHETYHEIAALQHRSTTGHLLGDCECFVNRDGYAARYTRDEWRERVAAVMRAELAK